MSQEDEEIMYWQITLFTGSSFQEIGYVRFLMVCVCIWGHSIKRSHDGEGLQDTVLHKGLKPAPIMIFPNKGRWSQFNSFPTPSLDGAGVRASYTGYTCWEVQAGQLGTGLPLLYNLQHGYQTSHRVTLRALMVSMHHALVSLSVQVPKEDLRLRSSSKKRASPP